MSSATVIDRLLRQLQDHPDSAWYRLQDAYNEGYEAGKRDGRAEERAAAVGWLRVPGRSWADAAAVFAAAFDRGAHVRREGDPQP